MSAIAAAAAFACAIVIAMWVPRMDTLLGEPVILNVGAVSALLVWCTRASALGAPRLSPDVEMALVLAAVALKSDDAALLSMVEWQYTRHVLDPRERYVPQVARTVLPV